MFPFDQTALPQLKPRRALIAVDFQNDFTSTDGALPVPEPAGYVDRTIQLASALRETGGDVIWVRSKFDGSRAVTGEKIIVSDDSESEERTSPPPASQAESPLLSRTSRGRGVPAALKAIAAARRRDRPSTSVSAPSPPSADAPVEAAGDPDPEAFLSKDEPACLKDPSSPASDWSLKVKDAMAGKKDRSLIKSHYSAFNGTRLLHVLRASMVMEIFICGSLANVGVYATAMDAAGHGLSITIVEDCCGYRSEARQRQAIESLVDYTGCEVASMKEVFETVGLEPEEGRDDSKKHEKCEDDIEVRSGADDTGRVSDSPDLVNPMTGLRLKSKSTSPQGAPADVKVDINGSAPCDTGKAEIKADSPPKSKLGETAGIDQVVSTTHNKEEDKDEEEESTSEAANPKPPSSSTEPKTVDMTPQLQPDSDSDAENLPAQKNLCEGDTDIIEDVLPPDLEAGVFDKLRDEIRWQRMSHQGGEVPRLVAVQGDVAADGSMPVYRHPSDESPPLLPFSPTVLAIKAATEKHLGHPLNHALIQYYRDGKDYISEHSDKTLDIVKNSFIANVSLGAQRTMVLRTKRQHKDPSLAQHPPPSAETTPGPGRQTQRAQLPHNSLCRMGLQTNMKWLHAIRQDKRAERDKTAAELAFAGARISLTFRRIGTFLDKDESTIWGQGATGKTREEAKPVVNGTGPEAIEMLKAFGAENHSSMFDWEKRYGGGFDVLHMSSSPRFFASTDPVANLRIAVMMAELGMEWAKGVMGPAAPDDGGDLPIKFVDNDEEKSTVNGELAIMLYLDSTHGQGADYQRKWKGTARAKLYTRFQEALTWTKNIQKLQKDGQEDDETDNIKPIRKTLGSWNIAAAEKEEEGDEGGSFLAGSTPTLADFVVWPTLHSLVAKHGDSLFEDAGPLKEYYDAFGSLESVKKAVGRMPLS